MPAPKKPIPEPCPDCGQPRDRQACGKPRCPPCDTIRQALRRHGLAALPADWEVAECDCGETFARSTQRKAVAIFCHRCRSESVKDPTPEEIDAATKNFQAGWDEHQRRHRLGEQREYYTIPQLDSAWLLPGGMDDRDCFNF